MRNAPGTISIIWANGCDVPRRRRRRRAAAPTWSVADIVGGSYPLVINILLALLQRERTKPDVFSISRWRTI